MTESHFSKNQNDIINASTHPRTLKRSLLENVSLIVDYSKKRNYKTLAVYGNGGHTILLQALWESLGGTPITLILVSGKPAKSCIKNVPIFTITDPNIPTPDFVVLSSHLYEKEMLDTCKANLPHIPVFPIHTRDSIGPLSLCNELFSTLLINEPFHILDAGAINLFKHGTSNYWPSIPKTNLQIIAFEPDKIECRKLENEAENEGYQIKAFPFGLWNKSESRTLYITENKTGSSFFPPSIDRLKHYYYAGKPFAEHMKIVDKATLPVTTLDSFWKENLIDDIDFAKLNIEGAEKRVLEGGKEAFRETLGIQIEMGFTEKVKGGPLFSDIDPLLRGMGFEFYDILSLNRYSRIESNIELVKPAQVLAVKDGSAKRQTSQAFEGHFLYFRRLESWKTLHQNFANKTFTKILKLACLMDMYGQIEAAIATLRLAELNASTPESSGILRRVIDSIEYQNMNHGFIVRP